MENWLYPAPLEDILMQLETGRKIKHLNSYIKINLCIPIQCVHACAHTHTPYIGFVFWVNVKAFYV